jgi:hypothetical protein
VSGVKQAAEKECAQITADVLGRIKEMTNLPRIGLKLESNSTTMHDIIIEHDWTNGAGEVWSVQTRITVSTDAKQVKWKDEEK